MVHFDGVLLLFSIWLAFATFAGIAGASFLLYNTFFLLFRDPLLWILGRMRFITSNFWPFLTIIRSKWRFYRIY